MAFQEKSFKSFNENDLIQAWIYTPICKPRGIVQIIHGFGEHSRRYFHMILKLTELGFVVAADDHVGHGKTAYDSGNWSDWGDKGYMTMAEDEHTLRKIVQEQYPNLPYFMFGHSMGSMIARCYATVYGEGINGLILCGTSGIFPTAEILLPVLKNLVNEGRGEEVDPVYIEALLSWMNDRCENPDMTNGWICGDPKVVEDHRNDPFNNFTTPPNVRSLYYFVLMMDNIVGKEWAEKVPASIPVYNIAGDRDPVGQYGEGVYAVSNWLADTGHKVKTKIYPGYCHEIHNYRDIRDEVEEGIINFMNCVIDKQVKI